MMELPADDSIMLGQLLHGLGLLHLLPCHCQIERAAPSSPWLHKLPQLPRPRIWIQVT